MLSYLQLSDEEKTVLYVLAFGAVSSKVNKKTKISKRQTVALLKVFEVNKFPSTHVKRVLVTKTGLEYPVIANWFRNRRRKEKSIP